ncbi:MFS transporter [Rhodohalobacter sulfatireducens]|uniref:MFS transporter n=1 Tax=Rhodohalobacter sulfatireducens TaxID=2911366 RepID=A0ABS9K8E1_9BACT|nr:MFS transporter [Rhodohalobacter sulfatireducens]MCG2587128.1 MFS transporter [Rhodohalobacter sulfatireducens]
MKNKSALATVFLVVVIDLLGFGIVLPLLPFYAQEFSASAVTIGLLYSVYSFMQLIFSPIWGSWSDRVGRRPIMLMSTFGAVIAYIIFGFAGSLSILFLSRIVAGTMGGNISTAQAYIADITDSENRARGMGLIGAAFGIGFVIGPATATGLIHPAFHEFIASFGFPDFAAWMEANRFALPGFFAAFLSFCSFLMVLFKLPETVDKSAPKEKEDTYRRPSVFSPRFWQLLKEQKGSSARGFLIPLIIGFFLLSFGESSLYSAFPLFAESQLNMSAEDVGIQFFYIGIIAVIVQGFLIKPLTNIFAEEKIFLVGNILMVIGLGLIPLAHNMLTLALFLCLMALGKSLNTPTITSLISQEASENNYGAVMGASQGLSGLGRMIGPTWGGALFAAYFGLPFVATAVIVGATIWIAVGLISKDNSR